jgi:hypothetical protein
MNYHSYFNIDEVAALRLEKSLRILLPLREFNLQVVAMLQAILASIKADLLMTILQYLLLK